MNCPKCGGATFVSNTVSDGAKVYRNRVCKLCKHSFYTTEEVSDCRFTLLELRDKQRKERELRIKRGDR